MRAMSMHVSREGRRLCVCGIVCAWVGAALPANVSAQDPNPQRAGASILIVPFFGSDLLSVVFGYDVADEAERHLATLGPYTVMVADTLLGRLPPQLASKVLEVRRLSNLSLACTHARQLASVARVSLVVCGFVTSIEEGVFEVTAQVWKMSAQNEVLELQAVRGGSPERVASEIVRQLPPPS
jgi:hypothetical protein